MTLMIGIGIGVVFSLVIIFVVLTILRKKATMSNQARHQKMPSSIPGKSRPFQSSADKMDQSAPYIRLHNTKDLTQVWEVSLAEEVTIGRDPSCQVCISEKSVARQQCKIYMNGAAIVENVSRTNITQLNGEVLNAPAEISWGDRLTCGRVTLSVEALVPFHSSDGGGLNMMTEFANV